MKSVLLTAPVLQAAGYGVHSRQIAKWLLRVAAATHELDVTVEPVPWGKTHMIVDPEAEDGLIGQMLQTANNKKNFYDVTIQCKLPNEWNPFLGDFNVGVTAGVETDRCNPAWIDSVNRMNMVVVPSEFTKQCFLDTGEVTTPIEVIPECYPEAYDTEQPTAVDLGLTTKFNFLVVGQITGTDVHNDRKNLPFTVKWLAETFAGNPDVGVILKTNAGASTQLDKRNVQGIFGKLLGEVLPPGGPTFYLLHGHMTDAEMMGLYTHPDIKALVSFTHGEGYCLPMVEAAACGLPVIATNWSGYLDFMNKGKFSKVDRMLMDIPESRIDGQIFLKGMRWANPIEVDAKRRLQKFYQASSIPVSWATDLKKKIRENYSFEAVSRIYSSVLDPHL